MKNVNRVLQLKITLKDSSPKIWRRIVVPSDHTFFDLHCAIQDAMGWMDGHLHGFRIAIKGTTRSLNIQYPDPDNDFGIEETLDERKEKIADYFGKTIKQCIYEYDFGDGWEHEILFEKLLPADPSSEYPQCIAGKNACPSEDSHGVWGYRNLQEVLKNPKHSEYKDMLDWLGIEKGSDFDPSSFNPNEVEFCDSNRRLKEYKKGFGV